MRGVDTNVLARYFTADDPGQVQQVRALFTAAERGNARFFVSNIALCELAWTLRGAPYHHDRDQIADALEMLIDTRLFEIQDRNLVRRALRDFRSSRADFPDLLLGHQSRAAGCIDTVTFDRKLTDAPGFFVLR